MRVGVVGMNGSAFIVAKPTSPDSPWLRERILRLPQKQLHQSAGRDFVGAFDLALDLILEMRGHRLTIIYVTAGGPFGQEESLDKLLMFAADKIVAVHGIYLGSDPTDEEALQGICTKAQLGFGSFYSAANAKDLESVLSDCLESSLPRPGNSVPNRVVLIIDHSEAMGARINGDSRIQIVSDVFAEKIGELI